MTMQRKRGELIKFFPTLVTVNESGRKDRIPNYDTPVFLRGQVTVDDMSLATVPGQMPIESYRFITDDDLKGVDQWSACLYRGQHYVVAIPEKRYGNMETSPWTQHYTLILRRAEIPLGPAGYAWRA